MLWVYVKWSNGNIDVFRFTAFTKEGDTIKFYNERGECCFYLNDAKYVDFMHVFTPEMASQFMSAVLHDWLEEHRDDGAAGSMDSLLA